MRVLAWFAICAAFSSVPPFFRYAMISGRAEAVIAELGRDAGRCRAPADHQDGRLLEAGAVRVHMAIGSGRNLIFVTGNGRGNGRRGCLGFSRLDRGLHAKGDRSFERARRGEWRRSPSVPRHRAGPPPPKARGRR